jgi:hypothetical protein
MKVLTYNICEGAEGRPAVLFCQRRDIRCLRRDDARDRPRRPSAPQLRSSGVVRGQCGSAASHYKTVWRSSRDEAGEARGEANRRYQSERPL